MLKIFQAIGPNGPSFTVKTLMGPITVPTREELGTRIADLRSKAAKVLGRELSDDEFTNGPPKQPLTPEQIAESRRQKVRAERAARLEAEASYSPEAVRLETAKARAEQGRVAALSPAQRELESAAKAAEEAEQRKADRAKKDEIKAGSAYKMVRSALDDAILIAKLDPAISQEAVDALTAQSEALNKTADVTSVRSNLAVIQQAISEQTAIQDSELQQAVSRAELRKRMLASGSTFDSVDVELVGSLPFVVLSANGQTKKVTQAKYDSRESDEALKSELFSGGESNV